MRQIITHFTDNDLYTFTVQYYILQTYPKAEVKYRFFDRNNFKYPKGFGQKLKEQLDGMRNVVITDEEIDFMRKTCYFLPEWYFTFLKGYRFNPNEVEIFQDPCGYLNIMISGKWYSTVMWEMPILSTISELMHEINGDLDKVDKIKEYERAYHKGMMAFRNGVRLSDMGTRRRFSHEIQRQVIMGLTDAYDDCKKEDVDGEFIGTSNVWFAKEFGLRPVGTMSHQIVSFEECVSGIFECNYSVMDKWSRCYDGLAGIYLYDCFGDKVFFNNLCTRLAKTYDGLRVDSGDEKEQLENILNKYRELHINPKSKSVVFSNALTIDKAIELHRYVNYRIQDSYGIGTHLCADVLNTETNEKFSYSNIVIKLIGMRLNENREWHNCVKLSCDKGKTLGDSEKCEYLLKAIGK